MEQHFWNELTYFIYTYIYDAKRVTFNEIKNMKITISHENDVFLFLLIIDIDNVNDKINM